MFAAHSPTAFITTVHASRAVVWSIDTKETKQCHHYSSVVTAKNIRECSLLSRLSVRTEHWTLHWIADLTTFQISRQQHCFDSVSKDYYGFEPLIILGLRIQTAVSSFASLPNTSENYWTHRSCTAFDWNIRTQVKSRKQPLVVISQSSVE